MLHIEFGWSNPRWIALRTVWNGDKKNSFLLRRKHWNHMQVTDRPSPGAPSLTQTIIVNMVYFTSDVTFFSLNPQGLFTHQSEKFLDLLVGTRTWRGADVWVQWFLHAVLRNFDLVIHLAQCGLDNQSAGVARRIFFLLRHLSKFPLFKKENPSCRFWDMALGSFAAAFWKRSLPPYTRVRWRGMVRCGALATKARNSMVVETSFADALVRERTNRVWRISLRAHRCC